jgi:hypothetical protein
MLDESTKRLICTIFGWDQPAELDDLHERIEAADAELQETAVERQES